MGHKGSNLCPRGTQEENTHYINEGWHISEQLSTSRVREQGKLCYFYQFLVCVVELQLHGHGESRMHRNGVGFMGQTAGTQHVVLCHLHLTVMSSLHHVCASQTNRCGGLKFDLAQTADRGSRCMFALLSFAVCLLGCNRGKSYNNEGKSSCDFRIALVLVILPI